MSLNIRGIAALGAVVVIGAATVGWSIGHAHSEGKPIDVRVTLTAGTHSIQAEEPTCWNDGKPLTAKAQYACQTKADKLNKVGGLPAIDVSASDRVGVGVDPEVAKTGWFAFTDGGTQGQATLATARKGNTYSGSVPALTVLNADATTLVTVVQADAQKAIYGVWYFNLKNKDA